MVKVTIVGSGDKAHGLGNMYMCNAAKDSLELVCTEPMPGRSTKPFNEYTAIEPFPDALEGSDIVILAIPAYALKSFIVKNYTYLKEGSILVDATNITKGSKDLMYALGELDIEGDFARWVKAFNDVGAIQEMQYVASNKNKLRTQICGPDKDAVHQVVALAEDLGFRPKIVPFDQYDQIRYSQDTIGWEWIHATAFMVALFLLVLTYTIVQLQYRPYWVWYTILARGSSKMFAWTAVYGLACSLLPGTIARLIHLFSTEPLPKTILWACNIRKHVGLIALFFMFLHVCMMLLLFGEGYFGFLLVDDGHMNWEGEASMLCAELGTALFTITGLASFPSVGRAMNKAQFGLVFGPVVWGGLFFSLLHIMFLGVSSWTEDPRSRYSWAGDMPPITLMSSLIPLLVLLFKAVQVTLEWSLYCLRNVFKKQDVVSVMPNDESHEIGVDAENEQDV